MPDAHVHIAAKIHVADSARVTFAADGLKLVDNFHCAKFRRTADSARRKCCLQNINRREIFLKRARDA